MTRPLKCYDSPVVPAFLHPDPDPDFILSEDNEAKPCKLAAPPPLRSRHAGGLGKWYQLHRQQRDRDAAALGQYRGWGWGLAGAEW